MKISEEAPACTPREIIDRVEFRRGRGAYESNLSNLFIAIKKAIKVSGKNKLERRHFAKHVVKFSKHFDDLRDRRLIEMSYECSPGSPLESIEVIEDEFIVRTIKPSGKARETKVIKHYAPNDEELFGDYIFEGHTFIDLPNVVAYEFTSTYSMNWMALMGVIMNPGYRLIAAKKPIIYSFLPIRHRRADDWDLHQSLKELGFSSVCNERKRDIDSWVVAGVNDIDIKRGKRYHVTLVTGDRDYIHPLEMFANRVKIAGAKVFFRIISWEASLSSDLAKFADEVVLLDKYHSVLDRNGWHKKEKGSSRE